eukprot:gene10818-biopygen9292
MSYIYVSHTLVMHVHMASEDRDCSNHSPCFTRFAYGDAILDKVWGCGTIAQEGTLQPKDPSRHSHISIISPQSRNPPPCCRAEPSNSARGTRAAPVHRDGQFTTYLPRAVVLIIG